MKKNQIIILVVVVVLILVGIIVWTMMPKGQVPPQEKVTPEKVEEVFSLSGVVSSVDVANNFLMVKPTGKENNVKVIISDTTKLIKLELPFDPAHPPAEATFTPKQTEITISGFKAGDSVFVKTTENIAGKTTFDNVDFIHILP